MAGKNYAKGVPMGDNQIEFQNCPPAVAAIVATVKDSSTTASSILVLNQNTTALEVSGTGGPVFIKWLTQAVVDSSVAGTSIVATGTTTNFDHVVPAATVRRFVVPIATTPSSQTSAMGANRANGLYPNVAYIGTATSVIAINQYGSSNSY